MSTDVFTYLLCLLLCNTSRFLYAYPSLHTLGLGMKGVVHDGQTFVQLMDRRCQGLGEIEKVGNHVG